VRHHTWRAADAGVAPIGGGHLPPNGGVDDLVTMWKVKPTRRTLPSKAKGPIRAQLRQPDARPARELGWSGGKAGT